MAGLANKITREEARMVADILGRADAADKTWILQNLIEQLAATFNAGRICIEASAQERPQTLLVLEKDEQNIRRIKALLDQLDGEEQS